MKKYMRRLLRKSLKNGMKNIDKAIEDIKFIIEINKKEVIDIE